MQNGSLIRTERQRGPAVWEFRWRELAGNGKRTHRRIVLGSVERLVDEAAARQAVSALCIDINAGDARITTGSASCANATTIFELGSIAEAGKLIQASELLSIRLQSFEDPATKRRVAPNW